MRIPEKVFLLNLFWRASQVITRNIFTFSIFYFASYFLLKDDFGIYNYVLSFAFLICLFVDFGISTAVSKFTAEFSVNSKFSVNNLAGLAVLLISGMALLVGTAVFLGRSFLTKENFSNLVWLYPFILFFPLTSLFDGLFRGAKRFKELSLITFISGLISMVFFYFLIRYYGLKGAFLSQDIFYLSMLCGFLIRFNKIDFSINRALLIYTAKYTLVLGLIGVFMFFSTRVDILFLGHYNFFTEVAYYEIISKLLALLLIPYLVIGHVISPDFTRQYENGNYIWVRKRMKVIILFSFLSSALISVGIYFFMPFIFETFFQKYYTESFIYMSTIMLILIFSGLFNSIIPLVAIATGHARLGMYFIVVVGVFNLILDYFSINYWGMWGLIYSTVILKSLANIGFVFLYYRMLRVDTKYYIN
ncbi:MAG: oligosaccharide flippase family protein [Bacteroidales bacterium]|nr:oligosaccharide flippase family protein [Bacteroidales bacterium]